MEIAQIAAKERIDGIAMCCSDFGLCTVGYVCDKLKLNGLSEKGATYSTDKLKMKQLLVDNGIPTAKYVIVRSSCDISLATDSLAFPMIVKAVDLQGSKGIFISKNEDELRDNIQHALQMSKKEYCLVEEFLIGEEFGAQAFVQNGKVLFVKSHGDIMLQNNGTSVPVGHYMPYFQDDKSDKELRRIVTDAINALGLDNCAVNVDLINLDGRFYIIELTGRAGANQLPEVLNKFYGINYYQYILKNAFGIDLQAEFDALRPISKFVMSRQLFSLQGGVVTDISITNKPAYIDVELFVEKGSEVYPFTNSRDCIGQLICTGENYDDCEAKISAFINENIRIKLENEFIELR